MVYLLRSHLDTENCSNLEDLSLDGIKKDEMKQIEGRETTRKLNM